MVKATHEDKTRVIELLTASFQENQSVNYIVCKDIHKMKRIRALMDYSFEMCFQFGEVWLADDDQAAALILFPQQKRTTILSIWLDLKLIVQAIGLSGMVKALNREIKIKGKQPKEPMTYLWFIGVDTASQHRGIGSKLLDEIIRSSNGRQLPVYLETSTLENLPWYERFKFKAYDQLDLGYPLYFLKREPDKS